MAKCKDGKCKSSANCDDCVTKHLTKQFKEKRAKAILKAKYNPVKRDASYDPFHWARGLPPQQIFKQPKRQDLAFTLQDVENQIEKAFAKRDKPNKQVIRVIHEGMYGTQPDKTGSFKPLTEKPKSASLSTSTDDLPSFTKIMSKTSETQYDNAETEETGTQYDVSQTDQETQHKPETGEIETQTEPHHDGPPSRALVGMHHAELNATHTPPPQRTL